MKPACCEISMCVVKLEVARQCGGVIADMSSDASKSRGPLSPNGPESMSNLTPGTTESGGFPVREASLRSSARGVSGPERCLFRALG